MASANHFTLFLFSSSQAERQGTIDYIQGWADANKKVMKNSTTGDENKEYEQLLNLFKQPPDESPTNEGEE